MQWLEVLAAKTDNSSSVPGIDTVEGENQWKERTSPLNHPLTYTHSLWHTPQVNCKMQLKK